MSPSKWGQSRPGQQWGCLGTVWQPVQQCSFEIFLDVGRSFMLPGLSLGAGSKVSGARGGGLAPNPRQGPQPLPKARGGWMPPPTETPIVQQPEGDGHAISPARPESRAECLVQIALRSPKPPSTRRSVAASRIPTSHCPRLTPKI